MNMEPVKITSRIYKVIDSSYDMEWYCFKIPNIIEEYPHLEAAMIKHNLEKIYPDSEIIMLCYFHGRYGDRKTPLEYILKNPREAATGWNVFLKDSGCVKDRLSYIHDKPLDKVTSEMVITAWNRSGMGPSVKFKI